MTMQTQDYEAPADEPEVTDLGDGADGGDDQAASPDQEIEARAREQGWRPDGGKLSAAEFIERGEKIAPIKIRNLERENKQLRDSFERLEKLQGTVIERLQAQHKADLEAVAARKRQAVENGDVEAYEALNKREDALRADPPQAPERAPAEPQMPRETQEFLTRHSWLQSDRVAMAAAIAAADVALQSGVTDVRGQIEAAERELRQIRPARFEAPAKPPSAEGGGGRPVKRGKGANDLPREMREAGKKLVAKGIYKDMAEYAADIWAQEG